MTLMQPNISIDDIHLFQPPNEIVWVYYFIAFFNSKAYEGKIK